MTEQVEFKLKQLPDSPGCYLMKSEGTIIYVGKAKNLKNRVRQYFQSSRSQTPKVSAMVAKIDDFDIVLVNSEFEALMLECNLIKLNMPYYNILLKDDKQYPYIAVDLKETYPAVRLKRMLEHDGLKYFGPYKSASVVREVLDVVRQVFPIRVCEKVLHADKKQRPCIHYSVGECLAPCTGNVTQQEYGEIVERVMEFLSGKDEPILTELRRKMEEASEAMQYERAEVFRDRIRAIEEMMAKQRARTTGQAEQDVLAIGPEGVDAMVECLSIREGKLIDANTYTMPRSADEDPAEVLSSFILQHYDQDAQPPKEILLPCKLEDMDELEQVLQENSGHRVYLLVPERGEKTRLVELAQKNLEDATLKRKLALEKSFSRTIGACRELADAIGMEETPHRIEGYDISNTQGSQSVASMVVMVDGVCQPKEYRHFKIRTVEGPNDFESMHEVITRRLKHGLEELDERKEQGLPPEGGSFSVLPDLILIDGGPGQLGYAQDAMHALGLEIPMFGLEERFEEIVLPGQSETILLDRHSEALHMIQRLRDEAHRFGITHHRKLRGKHSISSILDAIPGIGKEKKKALFRRFKTVEELKSASEEELATAEGIGPKLAKIIYDFFREGENLSDTPQEEDFSPVEEDVDEVSEEPEDT